MLSSDACITYQHVLLLPRKFPHCCSVTESCPALCDFMDSSMPGFPVLYHLLELAQTLIRWVSDAIQPSHPLSSPSPVFHLSQLQDLFQWVGSSYQVAKVLKLRLRHQSFQWIGLISFRIDWFDILAVHGTLKSLLQYHSLKASGLWCQAFPHSCCRLIPACILLRGNHCFHFFLL